MLMTLGEVNFTLRYSRKTLQLNWMLFCLMIEKTNNREQDNEKEEFR